MEKMGDLRSKLLGLSSHDISAFITFEHLNLVSYIMTPGKRMAKKTNGHFLSEWQNIKLRVLRPFSWKWIYYQMNGHGHSLWFK